MESSVNDDEGFDGGCVSTMSENGVGSQDVVDDRPLKGPGPVYDPASMSYDMTGNKLMYIFNHDTFQDTRHFEYQPSPRRGSGHDVARLQQSFENLKFVVEPCNNFTHNEIIDKLESICSMDHRSTSCIAISILTHGASGGRVCAADKEYPLTDVINYLLNSPRLAGKPKLFFVQACRGGNTDPGHRVQLDGRTAVIIPTHSDCLVLMATFDEFVSYRSSRGSWMIQTLCDVLDERHEERDVLHMMTIVNHRIASNVSYSKQFKYNDKKQIPEVRFTLTKFLKL